jgi:hypothetical protein
MSRVSIALWFNTVVWHWSAGTHIKLISLQLTFNSWPFLVGLFVTSCISIAVTTVLRVETAGLSAVCTVLTFACMEGLTWATRHEQPCLVCYPVLTLDLVKGALRQDPQLLWKAKEYWQNILVGLKMVLVWLGLAQLISKRTLKVESVHTWVVKLVSTFWINWYRKTCLKFPGMGFLIWNWWGFSDLKLMCVFWFEIVDAIILDFFEKNCA